MLNPVYTGYPHQQQQQLYPSVSQPPFPHPFGVQLQTNQQYGLLEQEKSIDEVMKLYLSDDQKPPPYPINGSQQQQKQQQQQQLVFDQLDQYLNIQQPPQPKVQAQIYPMYQPPPIQQPPPFQQPLPIQQQQPIYQQPPLQPQFHHPPFYNGLPDIPILTEELSKNVDPSYSKELDVLYILLQNATSKEELGMIFSGFAKKFLVLPSLWKYRLQLQSKHFTNIQSDEEIQITRRALHDFYSIETFSRYQSFKCFDRIFLTGWTTAYKWTSTNNPFAFNGLNAKEYLLYPHQHLVDVYNFYEEYGALIQQLLHLKHLQNYHLSIV